MVNAGAENLHRAWPRAQWQERRQRAVTTGRQQPPLGARARPTARRYRP